MAYKNYTKYRVNELIIVCRLFQEKSAKKEDFFPENLFFSVEKLLCVSTACLFYFRKKLGKNIVN